MFKAVQWIVTDTCKWVAAGMAEMDTCTLACGSQCSCQLLTSCQYWQWIKIGSVHLDLIKADRCAAVKAAGPFSLMHPWHTAMLELPHELKQLGSPCFSAGSVGVGPHWSHIFYHLTSAWTICSFFTFRYGRNHLEVCPFLRSLHCVQHFTEFNALAGIVEYVEWQCFMTVIWWM